MRSICWASLAGILFFATAAPSAPQEGDVTVTVVNYAELGKVIRDLRGQVVFIDFWGIT